MNETLRFVTSVFVACLSGGWLLLCAVLGAAFGLTPWSTTPVDAVLGFTAALLLGGLGVAAGCLTVRSLPEKRQGQRRAFEVLPPRPRS